MGCRRWWGERERVRAQGMTAATFRLDANRNLDNQIRSHTKVVDVHMFSQQLPALFNEVVVIAGSNTRFHLKLLSARKQ